MDPIRVLITSIGATGAQNVIKSLRRQNLFPVHITGCDADSMTAGKHMVDAFQLLPSGNSPSYSSELQQICISGKINILIPIMEAEIEKVAADMDTFRPFFPVLSSLDTIRNCNNKEFTCRELDKIGIRYPAIYPSLSEAVFPVIVKPVSGTGSQNITVYKSKAELKELNLPPGFMIQKFIEGTEYTVDCYTSFVSAFSECVPRKRIATKGGLATKTQTVENPALVNLSLRIIQQLNIKGPCNIQFIETPGGELYFLEVNPRFGGAFIASIEAGLNAPLFILNDYTHTPIVYSGYERNLLMLRFWQETYERHLV